MFRGGLFWGGFFLVGFRFSRVFHILTSVF